MNAHPDSHSDIKKDLGIFLAFIVVTLLIAAVNFKTPRLGITLMLLVVEAGLIVYYFAHLIANKKAVLMLLALTLVLAVSIIFWPGWDIIYSTRNLPLFE